MTNDQHQPQADTNTTSTARKRNHLIWLGPIIVFAGVVSYFVWFAQFPDLRDIPWVNLPITLFGVALSVIAVWRAFALAPVYRGKILGSLGLVASLGLAGLFCFYVFYLSYQMPGETDVTTNLKSLPDLELLDHERRPVRLSNLGGKNVVITFYRGDW